MPKKSLDKKENVGLMDKQKQKMEPPRKFKVIFHNDDHTPMDLVVELLEDIFFKSNVEATAIMLNVHNRGKGVAGVYSREIAETKSFQANETARGQGYPLLTDIEPE